MRDHYLAAMGIDVWKPRARTADRDAARVGDADARVANSDPDGTPLEGSAADVIDWDKPGLAAAQPGTAPASGADESPDWERLAAAVKGCTLCALHRTRTQTVFGVGRRDADLLVIGEAPGADEDREGEPFVGRAGRLLNAMLEAIGLPRQQVYIANILKCRPPNNRDPKPEEAAHCSPYLEQQIALVRPRAVLGVGRIAAQHLLQSDQPIGRLRGRVLSFGAEQTPIVVTYHPAYLLRSPLAKAKAWQDLCAVRRLIRA
jgi:uracil-DNA glycosylase family 4